jgi:hypothetical protein
MAASKNYEPLLFSWNVRVAVFRGKSFAQNDLPMRRKGLFS